MKIQSQLQMQLAEMDDILKDVEGPVKLTLQIIVNGIGIYIKEGIKPDSVYMQLLDEARKIKKEYVEEKERVPDKTPFHFNGRSIDKK